MLTKTIRSLTHNEDHDVSENISTDLWWST